MGRTPLPCLVVEVRPPSPEDVPGLRSFVLRAWRQVGPSALGWTGADEEAIQEIASEDFLRSLVADSGVSVLVAVEGPSVVGFAVVRNLEPTRRELAGIVVLETETGKGIGTTLLHQVLSDARLAGTRSVVVKTESFNDRALGFYRHEGFVETGRTEETVRGKKVPLVILQRVLATPS